LSDDVVVVVAAADTTPSQILGYWMENDAVLMAFDNAAAAQDFRSYNALLQSVRNVATVLNDVIPTGTVLSPETDLAVPTAGATECWSDADASTIVVHYYYDYDSSTDTDATTASLQLTLASSSTYSVQWYDLTNGGGDLQEGSMTTVVGASGSTVSDLGTPPSTSSSSSLDWLVILLECPDCSA